MPDNICMLCGYMVCGTVGELTKLRAYGFQLLFQVPLQRRGRSWRGSGISHTRSCFPHYEIFWDLYYDNIMFYVLVYSYETCFIK